MENLVTPAFWQGRKVFLTGHTGFKGSWLSLWLQSVGTELTGYALPPATRPNLFELADVGRDMDSVVADIRDAQLLAQELSRSRPEIVIHMAAQALVGEGYRDPLATYATNVMGTANLLNAVRNCDSVRVVVVVTTDKCYENREWHWPYREDEALGGHDPYSNSKACAELVTAAFRNSYFQSAQIAVATARAGNVFGGGDWSPDRLIPDLLAAFAGHRPAKLRRPRSIRPWQHVLEPLSGYLCLAERLFREPSLAGAWNFGPGEDDCLCAGDLADKLARLWGEDAHWQNIETDFPHEAGVLRLDSSKARQILGWKPRFSLDEALEETIFWQKNWLTAGNMKTITLQQIERHQHAHR